LLYFLHESNTLKVTYIHEHVQVRKQIYELLYTHKKKTLTKAARKRTQTRARKKQHYTKSALTGDTYLLP